MTPRLEFENVTFAYGDSSAILRNLSLRVNPGDCIGLIGPNGAGKTTLLKVATGLLIPAMGTVRIDGFDVCAMTRAQLARHIAVVPQRSDTTFDYTVLEIILMGTSQMGRCRWGFETPAMHAAAEAAMEQSCLTELRHRSFRALSGGEQQRVLLARAIAQGAQLIFLDEPTSSLDLAHRQGLFSTLKKLNEENGTTIVAIMHDLELASHHVSDVAVLHRGSIIARGEPRNVITPEILSEVYHVNADVHAWDDGGLSVRVRTL